MMIKIPLIDGSTHCVISVELLREGRILLPLPMWLRQRLHPEPEDGRANGSLRGKARKARGSLRGRTRGLRGRTRVAPRPARPA